MLNLRLALIGLSALLAGAVSFAGPALADLRVCNETGNPISIALGYRAERGWQSEGWWVAPPAQCATVFQGDLNSRFFYIFAADDIGGGAWEGSVFMCTRDESFTIFGVEDCLARGYERTGFFEVDTQNRSEWMLQLTDRQGLGPEAGSDALPDQIISLEPDGEDQPLDDPGAVPPGGADN